MPVTSPSPPTLPIMSPDSGLNPNSAPYLYVVPNPLPNPNPNPAPTTQPHLPPQSSPPCPQAHPIPNLSNPGPHLYPGTQAPNPNPALGPTNHHKEEDSGPCQVEAAPQFVGHAFLQVFPGLHQVEQDSQDHAGPCVSTGVRRPGGTCVRTPAQSCVAARVLLLIFPLAFTFMNLCSQAGKLAPDSIMVEDVGKGKAWLFNQAMVMSKTTCLGVSRLELLSCFCIPHLRAATPISLSLISLICKMGVVVGSISLGHHEELLRLAHSGSSKTEIIVALLGL